MPRAVTRYLRKAAMLPFATLFWAVSSPAADISTSGEVTRLISEAVSVYETVTPVPKSFDTLVSEAGAKFDAALHLDPGAAEAYFEAGLYLSRNAHLRASEYIREGLSHHPENTRLRALDAVVAARTGSISAALEECGKISGPKQRDFFVLMACAEIHDIARLPDMALADYARAMSVFDPVHRRTAAPYLNENPYLKIAARYQNEGRVDDALNIVKAYMASTPAHLVRAYEFAYLGQLQKDSGQIREAAENFAAAAARAVVAIDGAGFATAVMLDRAMLLVALGEESQAEEALAASLETSSKRDILALQFRLRSGAYPETPLSGHLDEATRKSMYACLKVVTCTSKTFGPNI